MKTESGGEKLKIDVENKLRSGEREYVKFG